MDHISLSELNFLVQDTLKKQLDPSYWVVAEIGELNVNQKGHCYLELIENIDDKTIAKARATIWSYTYRNLSTWFQGITGQPLAEGMKILANVKVNFHEIYGFSLNIQDIDANYTLGERERLRQEVIKKLIADGVFEMNKELSLPLVPQKVAVISSPTAAGYGDYIHHLDNNIYGYRVEHKLFTALMQGSEAPESIIAALHQVLDAGEFDIAVLIRGGGSQLDLECFDDYELCANIAQFPLPIITGIGHERDETIADMVANSKQKTPTAVAEFILQGFMAFEAMIDGEATRIGKSSRSHLQEAFHALQTIGIELNMNAKTHINRQRQFILSFTDKLQYLAKKQIKDHDQRLENINKRHTDLDPMSSLHRGFSFTSHNGKSIRGQKLKKGDQIETHTEDIIIESRIEEIKKDGKN